MASRNCFSNCIKSHDFLCIFPSNEWRNYVGPPNPKNDEIVLSYKALLPDVTSTFTSPPYLLSFLFLLMCLGRKIPIRRVCHAQIAICDCITISSSSSQNLTLAHFPSKLQGGGKRVLRKPRGDSSQGHALWKEGSRKPCGRFDLSQGWSL